METQQYVVVKDKYDVPMTLGFMPLLIDILGLREDHTLHLEVGDILTVDGNVIFVRRGEEEFESTNYTWILDKWLENGCVKLIDDLSEGGCLAVC